MRQYDIGLGGKNPERALLAAIVLQAVTDLDDPDETARYEAHEFFLQPRGGWADMRKFYFDALGLDEDRVLASLRPRLSPPERPEVRLTFEDVYRDLPRVPFAISDLIRKHRRGYSQLRGFIQTCEDKGLVVRMSRGAFCRKDSLPPPPAPPAPKPDARRIILDSLKDGPKTIREIVFAIDGELDSSTVREHLKRAEEECVVDYDIPFWSLRKIA